MTVTARGLTISERESKPLPRLLDSPRGSALVLIPPAAVGKSDDGMEDDEESTPTPTLQSLSSSAVSFSSSLSSSPSISPSSSITTDTSVTSDAHHVGLNSDKDSHEEHKVANQEKELNNDAIMPTLDPDANADLKHVDVSTIITASTSASTPSTPASSSSTSLPVPTPSSSSAPTSTSASTTTVNDLSVDSNGLLSLLRPRPQMNQLNVKFAPLPDLAPRKRKSNTPLGMAARSQLARRRRMMYNDSYDDDGMYDESYRPRRFPPPNMSEEGAGVDGVRQANGNGKKAKKKDEDKEKRVRKGAELEEEPEILSALAKKMGKAGKQLWRKMANGGKGEKEDGEEDAKKITTETSVIGSTSGELGQKHEKQEGEQEQCVVRVEEVKDDGRKMQALKAKCSVEFKADPDTISLTEPQKITDDTVKGSLTTEPDGEMDTATVNEGSSKLDGRHTTPAILVSTYDLHYPGHQEPIST